MSHMFDGVTLSTDNYDALLKGWATDSSSTASDGIDDIPNGVIFSGGNSFYCTSETERQVLIDTYGWTITDGGLNCGTLSTVNNKTFEFTIYPNPAKNRLNIENQSGIALQKLDIFDVLGQLVKTVDLRNTSTHTTIDISNLKTAAYFVKITSNQGSYVKKLIKR